MKFTRKAWYFNRWTLYWSVHPDAYHRSRHFAFTPLAWWVRFGRFMVAWHKPRNKRSTDNHARR